MKALGTNVLIIVLFSRDFYQNAYHSIALEKLYKNAFGSNLIGWMVEPQTGENWRYLRNSADFRPNDWSNRPAPKSKVVELFSR